MPECGSGTRLMSEPQRHGISDFISTVFVLAMVFVMVIGVVLFFASAIAWLIRLVPRTPSSTNRSQGSASHATISQWPTSQSPILYPPGVARKDIVVQRPARRPSKRAGWLLTGLIFCLFGVYVMATDGGDQRAAGSIFYLIGACWFGWRLAR